MPLFRILSLSLLLVHLWGGTPVVEAQPLSRSFLGSASSLNPRLSFSVGELLIHTLETPGLVLSQGFQQPEDLLETFVHPDIGGVELRVYPNPSRERLTLEVTSKRPLRLGVRCVDGQGRMVWKERGLDVQGTNHLSWEVQGLAEGVYQLLIYLPNGRLVHSLRFQKIN